MSETRNLIRNWLNGPSLGHYFRIHPDTEPIQHSEPDLLTTKELLKEQMVDSFFEQALHQINSPTPESSSVLQTSEMVFDGAENILLEENPDDTDDLTREKDYLSRALEEIIGHEDDSAPAEREEQEITATGYYIFAITLNQQEYELPDEELAPGYPLFLFGFDNIQAVISEVPLDEYGEEALPSRLSDPHWFEKTLKKHNAILSRIQSATSMVPVRICTICNSTEALTTFLSEHQEEFVRSLELIEGSQSWRFTIFCNQRKLRSLTQKASNRVRAIQAELSGKSSEEANRLMVRLDTVLEEEAQSVCRACIKHSHGVLSAFASKNLVHSLSGENRNTSEMSQIFRCEYLIENDSIEAFLNELQSLNESYKSLGFELQAEGPLPPTRFTDRKMLATSSVNQRKRERPHTSGNVR